MKTTIVTALKRQATRILGELAEDHAPVLITEHGRPAAYLVDVKSFELQRDRGYASSKESPEASGPSTKAGFSPWNRQRSE